jgi:hypothetical protein
VEEAVFLVNFSGGILFLCFHGRKHVLRFFLTKISQDISVFCVESSGFL